MIELVIKPKQLLVVFYGAFNVYSRYNCRFTWDITPNWMLRDEYHNLHGSSEASIFDKNNFFGKFMLYKLHLGFNI